MFKSIARTFIIKSRLEACLVIYAIAVGATSRGFDYLAIYPGTWGLVMFAACTGAVFMAGAKLLDATRQPRMRRRSLDRLVVRARANGAVAA